MEDTRLMKYATSEDDVSVELCICKNGTSLHWTENPPEMCIYIPESVMEGCAQRFVQELGVAYYGTTALSQDLKAILVDGINKHVMGGVEPKVSQAKEIAKFIEISETLSESHYLVFEGP